jgi:RNA polymerase sigma-70 factor (ECF subfamily)
MSDADLTRQKDVVQAFLAASRNGDFQALLAVLDPEVVLRADPGAVPGATATQLRGSSIVAKNALAFSGRSRFAQVAHVNGTVGIVVAPHGRLSIVLLFTISRGKIIGIDVVADPERLRELDLAILEE